MATTTTPPALTTPTGGISLRVPTKYAAAPDKNTATTASTVAGSSPPLEALYGTWTVTHSTLSMWRSASNVRITYSPMSPCPKSAAARLDDLVEYEPLRGGGGKGGGVKTVAGVDTAAVGSSGSLANTSWDWKGKGWLFFVHSHWEILGWGERPLPGGGGAVERWVVTWFQATLFTAEGVDIYCDRAEGLSKETEALVMQALREIGVKRLVDMVEKDMRAVEIALPWKER